MRLPRGPDDADVIRARLRALLADGGSSGWVPDAGPDDQAGPGSVEPASPPVAADAPEEDDRTPEALPSGVGRHRAPGSAVRLDPGRPGARALWVAAVVAVLALLTLTWWDRPTSTPLDTSSSVPAGSSARDEPAEPSAPVAGAPTAGGGTVVVSVVGRVARPGLVTLPEGARVADAVEAAGGLLARSDQNAINLAAPLADGQQVAVGVQGAAAPADPAGRRSGPGGPVDLNRAGVADLEALPGVGPVLAQRIVDHREQHGPFGAVDELQDVPGIGPAIFDGLADAVTV